MYSGFGDEAGDIFEMIDQNPLSGIGGTEAPLTRGHATVHAGERVLEHARGVPAKVELQFLKSFHALQVAEGLFVLL